MASVQCTTSSTALMTTVQCCHLGVHSTALLTSATATATRSTASLCFLLTHCIGACPLCPPRPWPLPPGPLLLYASYLLTVQVLVHSACHGHCHQVHCCSMFLTYSLYRCVHSPGLLATATRSTAALCFLLTVQVLVHSAHLGHGRYLRVCCCCVLLTYSLYRCLAVDSSQ